MRLTQIAFILTAILSTQKAYACAVCFGDANSLQAKGAMAGILLLLAVTAFVLASIGGLFWKWIKREENA